jgi:2-oxoglutarate ferredoxin oxidoreductase subunit alpha
MIMGASYGGTPALTATSGPGLSLMIEALDLATAAEIPIVVIDVMWGGPWRSHWPAATESKPGSSRHDC